MILFQGHLVETGGGSTQQGQFHGLRSIFPKQEWGGIIQVNSLGTAVGVLRWGYCNSSPLGVVRTYGKREENWTGCRPDP